jgi:hypothetical protein
MINFASYKDRALVKKNIAEFWTAKKEDLKSSGSSPNQGFGG